MTNPVVEKFHVSLPDASIGHNNEQVPTTSHIYNLATWMSWRRQKNKDRILVGKPG